MTYFAQRQDHNYKMSVTQRRKVVCNCVFALAYLNTSKNRIKCNCESLRNKKSTCLIHSIDVSKSENSIKNSLGQLVC